MQKVERLLTNITICAQPLLYLPYNLSTFKVYLFIITNFLYLYSDIIIKMLVLRFYLTR